MRDRFLHCAESIKENRYILFGLSLLLCGAFVFIAGIVFLVIGKDIPKGELYQCDLDDFAQLCRDHDPAVFYKTLQDRCDFLSRCASNFTSNVMTALCKKPCSGLFVDANMTADSRLIRTCSGNEDIGLGTMMVVWSGALLCVVFFTLCFCKNALCEPFNKMRHSFAEIFARPPRNEVAFVPLSPELNQL